MPLFDLDGTLIDSGPPIVASASHALIEFGYPPLSEDSASAVVGPPLRASFSSLTGLDPDGQEVEAMIACYRSDFAVTAPTLTRVYDGIVTLLDRLGPVTPLAVVTSKPTPIATQVLAQVGLLDRFEFVEGPSLDNAEPKSETLARALERINTRPSVMIGDRSFDMVAAVHHRIASIGITWGYGDSDELTQAGADRLATSPTELGDTLLGL